MLYSIAAWGLLGLASWSIGLTVLKGLRVNCFIRQGDRLVVAIWLGLVLLSNGLLTLALGTALSPGVAMAIAMGTIFLAYCWRCELRQTLPTLSLLQWGGLLAGLLMVAYYTSQRVTWIDAGLYHFGATRWLAEFGAVPGIALLLDNFGFTSAWFALAAPLSPTTIAPRVSAVANSFVLLTMMGAGLIALRRCLYGYAWVSDWFMVAATVLVLPVLFLTTFMSAILVSPSPDIPVIFLTIMVAWSILIAVNSSGADAQTVDDVGDHNLKTPLLDVSTIPLILSAGALSMKLTALPLLPVALLFYWTRKSFSINRFLVGGMLVLVMLLPTIVMGVVNSGCPFYPVSTLCLDLPWTLSAEEANNAAEMIRGWDRWFGTPPADANPLFWRVWKWLTFAKLNSIMVLLLLVSVGVIQVVLKIARKLDIIGISWLFSLGILGMGFILLRAPMIRFGLGYFVVPTAAAIAVFVSHPSINLPLKHWRSVKGIGLVPALILAAAGFIFFSQRVELSKRLVLPPAMPSTKTVLKQSHDVTYAWPLNERRLCWTADLPCSNGMDDVRLRNPDKGIAAGFIRVNKNDLAD